MDFDFSAQVDALAKLPPEPVKPPERSAWSLIPRAITSGAGKVGAAIVEGVAAVSPDEKDIARNPGSTAISSETLDSIARSARDFERSLRPDPVTASTAEQVVFGLTSGLTSAAAGAVLAGPYGAAAALGVGEGAVLTDDLQRQGVDDTTARLAGGVGGVVNAASVALPLAGQTLKATAGLYLLGGPAGFMAQQAATRAILENADYSTIGQQFDPFDPVGLALSALIPLPFAAHGAMRVVRAGKKAAPDAGTAPTARDLPADVPMVPDAAAPPLRDLEPSSVPAKVDIPKVSPEAVDAAMVHNLTLLRDAHDAGVRSSGPLAGITEDQYIAKINPEGIRAERPEAMPLSAFADVMPARPVLEAVVQTRDGRRVELLGGGEVERSIVAAVDGRPVGYIAPEGGTTGLFVAEEYRGQGIGEALSTLYRSRDPFAPSGGLSAAGEATARKAYRNIVDGNIPGPAPEGLPRADAATARPTADATAAQPLSDLEPAAVKPRADIPKVSPEAVDAAMVHNLTLLRDVFEATPVAQAAQELRNMDPIPDQSGMAGGFLPQGVRRAIENTLLLEGKQQTRYMGNKREFFKENARFIARDVAPLTQQVDTLFDMYAGGGTYGLTTALSGAMPNLKRVVVNEVDPLRAMRFRLAAEQGAEIMKPWETDPKLRELADQLRPLVGKSSTPASLAMSVYQGDSASPKYLRFAELRKQHGDHSEASQVARLALNDVFFSGRTASWDRLLKTAAQDAERIRGLASRARAKGIAVEVSSYDSLGPEAISMVKAQGGNSFVMLDPPYHTTTSGTYSAGGKKFDFASDEFLAANMAAAREMSDGNVVLYNNKDTPQVRQNFSDNFRGSMSMRGWKRNNGQREFLGVYDGRSKSGDSGLRVGDTTAGLGTEPSGVDGRVLDGSGGDPGRPLEADPPGIVQGAEAPAARTAGVASSGDGPPDFGPLTPAVEQARAIFEANSKAIDQYLATNDVPPEVNNLLIGLSEAGKDPRRVAAFLDIVAKQDSAKSAADATADAVEGMRSLTDEQLTNTPPDTIKPAIDPLMQSISDRVAAVQLAAPDMVVGLDASGNPITVADEIARIRKEAFEGTDTELGAADAELVNVAANCALSVGA